MGFSVTNRINKIYKVFLILLIISLSFTSCTLNGLFDQNTSEGFEKGLKFSPPNCPGYIPDSPSLLCACKSDKSEFGISFVILDFYYGGDFSESIEFEKEHSHDYPWFEIYFSDDYGNRVFSKRVFENFISEKYRCDVVRNESGHTLERKFNYSEKIWIPKKLFTKESGVIYVGIYGENQRYDEPKYECITSMSICYKVIGNKVILSAEEIK